MAERFSPFHSFRNAAEVIVLTAVIASCKGTNPTTMPFSFDNKSSLPIPTETMLPTSTPRLALTPELTIKPMQTQSISTPEPTADPNIECDQRLVPNAESVPPVTKEPSASFKLNVPILEYHRIVGPEAAGLAHLKVPPATFDAQMKKLHDNGWTTITLAQLAYDLEHEIKPAAKTFVVSLDDGYADGYSHALLILQKYGFVGTFFIITSRRAGLFLTPDEVRALAQAGNEIADHTADHVSLTYGNPDKEVDTAAEYIAQVTGKWPSTLAYPFGSFSTYAKNAVARCQPMRMAVTTVQGVGETWATRFRTSRLQVFPGTTPAALLAELSPYAEEK